MTDALRPALQLPKTPQIASLSRPQSELERVVSPMAQAWRRYQKNTLALIGLFLLVCYIGIAIGADAVAPYGYNDFDFASLGIQPDTAHFLGTDSMGRDMLTVMMYGSRVSVAVGFAIPIMILLIGVPIGVVAGYFGGKVDNVLMRATDTVFAVPPILLTLVLVTLIGRDVWVVIFALGITSWPQLARVARAETLRLRKMEFVESARAVGASHIRVMFDHMLPNLLSSVVVTTVVTIPTVIITEATLTFLGIGVEASIPSWALMIRMAYQNMFSRPLLIIFPSIAISTLTLAFAFVGDGLRDALDPRLDDRI